MAATRKPRPPRVRAKPEGYVHPRKGAAPRRWARGGGPSDESATAGSAGAGSSTPAAAAPVTAVPASAADPLTRTAVSDPSLFTDYWHLESALVQWRSEALRASQVLEALEAHLRAGPTAEEVEAKAKAKAQRKKNRLKRKQAKEAKAAAAAAVEAEGDAAVAGGEALDLTADEDAPVTVARKRRTAAAAAASAAGAAVSSCSSESDEEVNISRLVSFAHRAALNPEAAAAAAASGVPSLSLSADDGSHSRSSKSKSRKGRKLVIREDEDEGGDAAAAAAVGAAEHEVGEHAAGEQAAAAAVSQNGGGDGEMASSDEESLSAEWRGAEADLRGLLSSFHSSQRRVLSRQKKKAAKEDALFGRTTLKARKRKQRGSRTPSPSPPPKRRRMQKSHRLTMWKDEPAPKASAAAAAVAASSVGAAAAAAYSDNSGAGLPIEERLRRFPSHFLCLGFLRLRQAGAVDVARVTSTPLRVAFAQKLLPLPAGAPAAAAQAVDPDELLQVYVRAAEESPEARERRAALAAERRAQAKLRKQREEEEEDAMFARMVQPEGYSAPAASAAAAAPSMEFEEKTGVQPGGFMQDEEALSAPIIWHPSAVLGTHHVRPVRFNVLESNSAAAAASSGPSLPSSSETISSATLEALFALFGRHLVYLHPVYSPAEQCFTLFVYLMPHAWYRAMDGALAPPPPPPVHRMDNEVVCAQMKHVLFEWGCQANALQTGGGSSLRRNNQLQLHRQHSHGHGQGHGHFNPHQLFEACRPPAVSSDETLYPAAAPMSALLRSRGLKPTLRPYQTQAVCWMLLRERQPWRASSSHSFRFGEVKLDELGLLQPLAAGNSDDGLAAMELDDEEGGNQAAPPLHPAVSPELEAECQRRVQGEYAPSWLECIPPSIAHPFADNSAAGPSPPPPARVWLQEHTGVISARPPASMESLDEVRGGMLADEMGLGKTLMVISAILANPRHASPYGHSSGAAALQAQAGSFGGAVIPILPRTILPPTDSMFVAAGDAAKAVVPFHAASSVAAASAAPRPALPAPPLLVDPLELSKRAYAFYQDQVAAAQERERVMQQQQQLQQPPSYAAMNGGDDEEGEAVYGQPQPATLAAAPRRDISCYCGHDEQYFHNSGERLVECQLCHTLQHALCMRVEDDDDPSRLWSFVPNPPFPYSYLCPTCASLPATPKQPIGATLIVCPDVILAQWVEELARHVESGLGVLVYRGVRAADDGIASSNAGPTVDGAAAVPLDDLPADDEDLAPLLPLGPQYSVFVATEEFVVIKVHKPEPPQPKKGGRGKRGGSRRSGAATAASAGSSRGSRNGSGSKKVSSRDGDAAAPSALPFSLVRPAQFRRWDVVLTTYSTLQQDLYHAASSDAQGRAQRYAKKYRVLPTPLLGVNWWRVALDEAQMMGDGAARCAEMALQLSAVHRWSVTGTPIYKSMEGDLYGLLLFLGLLPYANRAYWRRVLAGPYEAGHPRARARMHALLGRVMWRNSKASVAAQLQLPPTTTFVTRVNFTPVERYFYDKRKEECRSASALLRAHGKASLSHAQLRKVMHSLLRLRQACVHPQIGSTHGLTSLSKHTMTLSELSLAMLKDARLECEEIQRRQYFAMHGLAALAIIKHEYAAAVELYERVVGGDEQDLIETWRQKLEDKQRGVKDEQPAAVAEAGGDEQKSSDALVPAAVAPSPPAAAVPRVSRREIAIDDLQKIHALHNLADALAMQHGAKLDDIPPADLATEQTPAALDDDGAADAGATKKEEQQVKQEESGMADVDQPAASSAASAAPAAAADPSQPSASALATVPPATLQRIRLLRRFVSDLRAGYLSRQAVLVADAQHKFHSAYQAVHEHLNPAVASGGVRALQSAVKAREVWWLDLLARLAAAPELEERFIAVLRRDLLEASDVGNLDRTAQASRIPSIAESFRNTAGLKIILTAAQDALEAARGKASHRLRLQTIHQPPLDSEIRQSSHCGRCRAPHQNGPLCVNCRSSSVLSEYEQLLYRFRVSQKSQYVVGGGTVGKQLLLPGSASGRSRNELKQIAQLTARDRAAVAAAEGDAAAAAALAAEGGLDDDDERRRSAMFQTDCELQQSLRILLKFCTDHLRELRVLDGSADADDPDDGSGSGSLKRLLDYGHQHQARFDLYKKELKAMLDLNRAHREQLSLYDELEMSSLRIRLRYDGEEVPPAERHFKLMPHEVDHAQMQFESDIAAALADMRDWRARLRFLEAQVQEALTGPGEGAAAGAGSSESSTCSICLVADLRIVTEVAVLPCAHRFCRPCIAYMLSKRAEAENPYMLAPLGKVASIKCPSCRLKVARREVLYVSNTKKTGQQLGGAGVNVDPTQPAPAGATPAAGAASAAPSSGTPAPSTSAAAATDPPQPSYPMKGSWSSKIHAVLQCVLHILAQDASAKILLYSEWAESLLVIAQALRANSLRFLQIGGGAAGGRGGSKKKMHATLSQFKQSPAIPLLLLPLTSAASGLNIVEASHLILVEPSLSPGKELQAVGRIVRIGQQRPTFVHRFLIAHSVEERIFAAGAAQRQAAHKAEQAAHNDQEEEEEAAEETTDGEPLLLGARGQGEEALDAREFASLLADDDDGQDAPQGEASMEDDAEEQEERDLQAAIRASQVEVSGMEAATDGAPAPAASLPVSASEANAQAAEDSVLAPSESAALASIAAETAAAAAQHRYWTAAVRLDDGRRMARLQALAMLQRLAVLDPARRAEAGGEQDGAAASTSSAAAASLVAFHGKWLTPLVAEQLQQLPLADDSQ